ncbi:MAG: CoA transferase [Alphaproteobacteria bacterium]|nr:CoA transferase [Alphaproteobacteria bacterium]
MTGATGALSGLRVIDLTRILAGPSCTQILGDHGADVIKVEPPGGDEVRTWGPPFKDGEAAYFMGVNRNKRSLVLDLSKAQGAQVLLRLLDGADVMIENFKQGTLEKWGLGYAEVLRKRFPRLVHLRITGFGLDGPMGGFPGYDAIVQALCGMMSINGTEESGAVRMGAPMADLGSGLSAAYSIMMALYERERSGRGQSIEVALYDVGFSLLHPYSSNFFVSGKEPKRTGNGHPNIAPYTVYQTRTGNVFVGVGNERQFARLCQELGKPELAADPRFKTNSDRSANRDAINAELAALLADKDGGAFCEHLLACGVPAGAVQTIPQVAAHPHTRHRRMVVEKEGYRGAGVAVKLSRTPGSVRRRPPRLAEHSREVLREAGYSDAEIDSLARAGAVGVAQEAAE